MSDDFGQDDKKIDTGGFAYPCREEYDGVAEVKFHTGMTLLDYFAAKALAGYISAFSGDGVPIPVLYGKKDLSTSKKDCRGYKLWSAIYKAQFGGNK